MASIFSKVPIIQVLNICRICTGIVRAVDLIFFELGNRCWQFLFTVLGLVFFFFPTFVGIAVVLFPLGTNLKSLGPLGFGSCD